MPTFMTTNNYQQKGKEIIQQIPATIFSLHTCVLAPPVHAIEKQNK